jgi:nitroreductase
MSATEQQQPVPIGEDAPIFEVMSTMRAMRKLKPDPVSDELLEKIVQAGTWAPSGGNAQTYDYLVVTDRGQMAKLAELWRRSYDTYVNSIGAKGAETMTEEEYARLKATLDYQADHFHETPALIIPCYRSPVKITPSTLLGFRRLGFGPFLRMLVKGTSIGQVTEAASIYPGVQNMLLAARTLGLAANITTWHMFLEPQWKAVLGIPRSVHTYAVIPVGWPMGRMGPVRRRPAAKAIHRDRW